eukprot:1192158-Prorocentrum_minimum.AAC.7
MQSEQSYPTGHTADAVLRPSYFNTHTGAGAFYERARTRRSSPGYSHEVSKVCGQRRLWTLCASSMRARQPRRFFIAGELVSTV